MPNTAWEQFVGGVYREDPFSADLVLPVPIHDTPRVIILDPTATHSVTLPDATLCRLGGPVYYVINLSTTQNVTIKDADANTLATLVGGATRKGCKIHLVANTTTAGSWVVDVRDMRSVT